MKKLFLSILLVSTLFLTGCAKSGDDKEIKIAYTTQTLSNPYFVTVAEGFEAYGKEKGIKTIVTDGKQDASAQVAQVENFIAQKVDAIVITPVNDKALEDVVKQAIDAGIVVVAANQDFLGSQAFVTIHYLKISF